MESQTARQGPHHRGDLHAHAQCPLQVGQAYSAALEGSTTAPPRALHAAAGPCGIGRERRSLRGDARRSARWLWGPRREVSQRRLGSALAGWPGNAVLHAFTRGPPSRAGVYARASARISGAERGGVRDLELGKAVERVRVSWGSGRRFLRNRSRAQAAQFQRLPVPPAGARFKMGLENNRKSAAGRARKRKIVRKKKVTGR